jgi:hypothetical protein
MPHKFLRGKILEDCLPRREMGSSCFLREKGSSMAPTVKQGALVVVILSILAGGVPRLPAAEPGRTLRLAAPASFLPGVPVLVRVEVLEADGLVARDLWDAEAVLTVNGGASATPVSFILRNGRGSAPVTLVAGSAGANIEMTAAVGDLRASRTFENLEGDPLLEANGSLVPALTEWSGIVHVTGALTVPAGKTLRILPGALVLVDAAATGYGQSIDIKGTLDVQGTEEAPVVFTARNTAKPWGEIHHDGAEPSVYRHAIVTRAGNSAGAGHTGTGPAIRATDSKIRFESCSFTDTKGKTMQASGSDLEFVDCLLSRSVMGPEVDGTAVLFERCHSMDMKGTDDNDGIYLHDQRAGQRIDIRGSVFAACDDDGIDTLGSDVTIEDCIVRDFHGLDADAKGISLLRGEVQITGCLVVDNEVGISAKGQGTRGATVRIDRTTVVGRTLGTQNQIGIQAEDKYGIPDVHILYFVKDSIVRAPVPIRTDYAKFPDDISVLYTDLSGAWTGTGNIQADPLFVDPAAGDYRLRAGSPCIDAGDPLSSPDPDGTRADMGFSPFSHGGSAGFVRGLVNEDLALDISDAVAILFHLYAGRAIGCREAADANDDGEVDGSDAISLLEALFLDGPAPGAPAGTCGTDPTPDDLGCASPACP